MGCPISSSEVTGTLANGSIIIGLGSLGTVTVPFSDLGGGNVQTKAGRLQQILQNFFDVRQPLSSLTVDDPDKFTNPNRPDLFWSNADGIPQVPDTANTHLTGRNCKVTITVTGSGANTSVSAEFAGV